MTNVAFCRDLFKGCKGSDVVGHKIALHHAMPRTYKLQPPYSTMFGPIFEAGVREFQVMHGLHPTGRIDERTHTKLEVAHVKGETSVPAFNAHAAKLCADFCAQQRETKVREAIVAAAFYWYHYRSQIAYSQARPFQLGKPPWVPSEEDCSGFVTACHYAGGAPDPNGRGYDHQGYTGTLMNRGMRMTSVDQLSPGDLIFYGWTTRTSPAFPLGSPTHVTVYVGNHMVISNGHHPMGFYPFDYTRINHFRHYQVV